MYNTNTANRSTVKLSVIAHHQRALELKGSHNIQIYYHILHSYVVIYEFITYNLQT
jgi:hypothetical protein